MQRYAVVAAAMLAHLDQATQPALQQPEFPNLRTDRDELGFGGPHDLVGRASFGRAEQVADFSERESELPGSPDESRPPAIRLGVFPEGGPLALRQSQQSPPLIEAHGLDADTLCGGEFPDRQPGHAHKLTAVPRYRVNSFHA